VKIVEKENDFKLKTKKNIVATFKMMARNVHIKRV